jgi:hypothetical protein
MSFSGSPSREAAEIKVSGAERAPLDSLSTEVDAMGDEATTFPQTAGHQWSYFIKAKRDQTLSKMAGHQSYTQVRTPLPQDIRA